MTAPRDEFADHVGSRICCKSDARGGGAAACGQDSLCECARCCMSGDAASGRPAFAVASVARHDGTFQRIA